jgi:hypothetical protein
MAGMPEMQEQFPANGHEWTVCRKRRSNFRQMAMNGRYAGNAGAISGKWPWMAGMPEMQEQFPANGHGWLVCRKRRSNIRQMAADGRYAENSL